MPQIFDVTANENARYKRNELECIFHEIRKDRLKKKFPINKFVIHITHVNEIDWVFLIY